MKLRSSLSLENLFPDPILYFLIRFPGFDQGIPISDIKNHCSLGTGFIA